MMPDVFAVSPDTELSTVVEAMAAEKYGCALIQEKDGRVVGVVTTVDACRLLAELLKDKKADWDSRRRSMRPEFRTCFSALSEFVSPGHMALQPATFYRAHPRSVSREKKIGLVTRASD